MDNENVKIKYVEVKKMQLINKEFEMNYGELKLIVDSLGNFIADLGSSLEKDNGAYQHAVIRNKKVQTEKLYEKLSKEISYCEKCNRKQKEETGFDGITALVEKGKY